MSLEEIKSDLREKAKPEKVSIYQNFFKTGKGQYGEGDIFIGVTVPDTRSVAKKHLSKSLQIISDLLQSKIHEERYVALLILVEQYKKFPEKRKEIYEFYMKNTRRVNNWDLVDSSADDIVGPYLEDKDRSILYSLAESDNLWERRISIISTFYYIKKSEFKDTLKISEMLLSDSHDLIHKAVGWMLREIGKKDQEVLEKFLKNHYTNLPRTTLRYAIERFPEEKRKSYLKGDFK